MDHFVQLVRFKHTNNMQPSYLTNDSQQTNSFVNLIHRYRVHTGFIAGILFSIGFWNYFPDLDVTPFAGKIISTVAILILTTIVAYSIKWSAVVGIFAMMLYISVSLIQPVENIYTDEDKHTVTYLQTQEK